MIFESVSCDVVSILSSPSLNSPATSMSGECPLENAPVTFVPSCLSTSPIVALPCGPPVTFIVHVPETFASAATPSTPQTTSAIAIASCFMISDLQPPTSNLQPPTSNLQPPTSDLLY